jgi:hypothetical protein
LDINVSTLYLLAAPSTLEEPGRAKREGVKD